MKPKAKALPHKSLPPCQKCQSYKVTWDSGQPHACLFFNFKSYLLPALEVYHSTGMACPQYRLAKHHKQTPQFQNYLEVQGTNQINQVTELPLYSASGQLYSASGQLLQAAAKQPLEQQTDKQAEKIEPKKLKEHKEQQTESNKNNCKQNRPLLGEGILL